jgi:hypothetical protein
MENNFLENMGGEGNFYTLGHLIMFTGLTDRTLRNYIKLGLLEGEKINGLWHFTPEQVERFITNEAVRPSILAKNNALIYDFILDRKKNVPECVIVLDITDRDRKAVSEFFCYNITNNGYHHIKFSMDAPNGEYPRVILKGHTDQVMKLVNAYFDSEAK